ncbi:MAG: hypothetical protein RSB39_09100 [Oscillospiraceae bacterium]
MSENKGKTIAQIAAEIGVSKTAIRKKLTDEIRNQFSETIGNTVYIDKQGETLIKSTFSQSNGNQVSENQTETVSVLVSMLQKELEVKNEQLEAQQKNIAELTVALQNTTDSLKTAQALHAGTIQQQLTPALASPSQPSAPLQTAPEPKRGFFARVFGN